MPEKIDVLDDAYAIPVIVAVQIDHPNEKALPVRCAGATTTDDRAKPAVRRCGGREDGTVVAGGKKAHAGNRAGQEASTLGIVMWHGIILAQVHK